MVDSQELLERSIYYSILRASIELGFSINPDDYMPSNLVNKKKYEEDISKIAHPIYIYSFGNPRAKGPKDKLPRITLDSDGFYPGSMGLPNTVMNRVNDNFEVSQIPYESKDIYFNVHLVCQYQEDLRRLHQVMYRGIPMRGYIKPWNSSTFLESGNIYVEENNFFEGDNASDGIIEKVYQYKTSDSFVETLVENYETIPPMTDVSVLFGLENEIPKSMEINKDTQVRDTPYELPWILK